MKIKTIEIASFGGIKDKVIELSDGFNLIYGDNENGKTTVMNFIKMMFYGNERGSSQISKNIRKKYTPWDGSSMAGKIKFEHSGRNYLLEREFRSSNSTDRLVLTDLALGTREVVAPNIGERFFGLSASAFERSVFIGQNGKLDKDSAAEGEINAKLSNIVSTGDESVSYNTVKNRLEKAYYAQKSKSGRTGEYDKILKKTEELKEKLAHSQKILLQYEEYKKAAALAVADIENKSKTAADLKARIEKEQDVRNAVKMREMLALKDELDKLNEDLKLSDGSLLDTGFIKKIEFCLNKTETYEKELNQRLNESQKVRENIELMLNPTEDVSVEKANQLKNTLAKQEKTTEELSGLINKKEFEFNNLKQNESAVMKSRKVLNLPLLCLSLVLFALSFLLFVLKFKTFGGLGIALSVILLICAFVFRPSDKAKIFEYNRSVNRIGKEILQLKENLAGVNQNLNLTRTRLAAVNAALNSSAALIDRQKSQLADLSQEINEYKNLYEKEKEELLNLFSRYKKETDTETIKQQLPYLNEKAVSQKELKQRLNYIVKDIGNISYEEAERKLKETEGLFSAETDFESLKKKYNELINEISDKKYRLASIEATAKAELGKAAGSNEIENEIRNLSDSAQKREFFCLSVDTALKELENSFVILRESYGSALEKTSGEIMKELTDGKYGKMMISKSFDMNLESDGVFGSKESDYLSSGTEDQAYLSLRLALSKLIFGEGETMPLMLDDVLCQYDDGRAKTAVEYLNKLSKKEQVILFTCHGKIIEFAKELGIETANL